MKLITAIVILFFIQFSIGQKKLDQLLKKHNDNSIPYISVKELAMPSTKVVLLDAREIDEYNMSHLKNAIHVGYNHFNIKSIIDKIPNKDQAIVVYCSLGIRSEAVAKKITSEGYINVKNLYGGIFEWKNTNFTIYKKNNIITDSVHSFSKNWSKWLKKGIKYFPKKCN